MLNYNHLMSTNDILSKPYDERKIRPVANLNSGTTCFFQSNVKGFLYFQIQIFLYQTIF